MKQRSLIIIAVASGIACAACIVFFLLSVQGEANAARAEALARYGGEQVEVCVATRDISAGERIEVSALESRLWIADLLPDNAIRDSSEILGKTVSSPILKGEVISSKRFEGTRSELDIPAGKEAVSVPAKAVQAVGGAIRPGMSVDVYASGDTTTAALARDVIVLDTSMDESGSLVASEAGWITLAVDPDRVQEIIAASNKTSLYFVLPSDAESKGAASSGSSGKSGSRDSSVSDAPTAAEASSQGAQDAQDDLQEAGEEAGAGQQADGEAAESYGEGAQL